MSNLTYCPNCQHPVVAGDDICDNCGAVISTLVITPVATDATLPTTLPPLSVGSLTLCPNCKQTIKPGDEICAHCGMVLASATVNTLPGMAPVSSTPSPDALQCPNCHAPRSSRAKFCGRCGFRFPDSIINAPIVNEPAGQQIVSKESPENAPTLLNAPVSAGSTFDSLPAIPAQGVGVGRLLNNKYRVLREIGTGGMGTVYLAEDIILRREVVIKALLRDVDPELVRRSVREREFLAAIKHANIVSIYDFIATGSQGYIVMEYVHGKTLDQLMDEQQGPFKVDEAIRYILNILPAFTFLARLDLVYCDFKPQNVMVEQLKDGTRVVKLIDLGTVIKSGQNAGDVYGTHGFYAPEAVKAPTPETDLYSICRTLAYLVTQMDLADPIFGMPPAEQYKVFQDHPSLYRLLVKGTHTNPARRFHSAEELSDQLSGVLRQVVGGRPGEQVTSQWFIPAVQTTMGKLGLRAEAKLDESDPSIDLLRYGDQALRNGNYTGAQSFYEQALKAHPRSLDAHLRIAEIAIDQGNFALAEQEIDNAQKISPEHWKITWYRGRLLEAQEKFSAAADFYRDLMTELPGELPPQQALARVYARLQRDVEAVDLYVHVYRTDRGNTEAILGAAEALSHLKRWDEAAQILRRINEASARYVDAQLMLIDLYLHRIQPMTPRNVQQAAIAVQRLEGRTEDPRYYLARGDVYRAAWSLARDHKLPENVEIEGVPDTRTRTLGTVAAKSYRQYLRRRLHTPDREDPDREEIVRRKFEVTPWHLF
jgi:serine/threonine-protein kinase PknG